MTARLNTLTHPEITRACSMSLGRNTRTSATLEITDFGDCVRNDYWWDDGACRSILHDTKDESNACRSMSGFGV